MSDTAATQGAAPPGASAATADVSLQPHGFSPTARRAGRDARETHMTHAHGQHDGQRAQSSAPVPAFRPVLVAQVELAAGLRSLVPVVGEATRAWPAPPACALVLLRLHTHPLGMLALDLLAPAPEIDWPAAVARSLSLTLAQHLHDDGADVRQSLTTALWEGVSTTTTPCLDERRATLARARPATVVIATRERVDALRRCLDSVLRLEYPRFEVVVVDNAPSSDATATAVLGEYGERVRYVREDRPGLASAHNRALEVASGEILAFTDDDVVVDPSWLAELATPFNLDPSVACATGLIVPAEIETEAQLLLEAHGHFAKGFSPNTFDLRTRRPTDPLFPYSAGALGSGANMAFDSAYLRRRGGFNRLLGTGTPAMGGDDLAAFFQVITAGRALAYRPGAVVWHHHRRDLESVARQAYGYGVGFGAYLASVLLADPRSALNLARHLPSAARAFLSRTSADAVDESPLARSMVVSVPPWPNEYVRAQRRGLLAGPSRYVRSATAQRSARPRHRPAPAAALGSRSRP